MRLIDWRRASYAETPYPPSQLSEGGANATRPSLGRVPELP